MTLLRPGRYGCLLSSSPSGPLFPLVLLLGIILYPCFLRICRASGRDLPKTQYSRARWHRIRWNHRRSGVGHDGVRRTDGRDLPGRALYSLCAVLRAHGEDGMAVSEPALPRRYCRNSYSVHFLRKRSNFAQSGETIACAPHSQWRPPSYSQFLWIFHQRVADSRTHESLETIQLGVMPCA